VLIITTYLQARCNYPNLWILLAFFSPLRLFLLWGKTAKLLVFPLVHHFFSLLFFCPTETTFSTLLMCSSDSFTYTPTCTNAVNRKLREDWTFVRVLLEFRISHYFSRGSLETATKAFWINDRKKCTNIGSRINFIKSDKTGVNQRKYFPCMREG